MPRIEVLGLKGESLCPEWAENNRGFTDFVTGLSILLGSSATPWEDWGKAWLIKQVEDDPAGFLPLGLCEQLQDMKFGSHQARVVIAHMNAIGFKDQSDEVLVQALNRDLGSGLPFEGAETLRWFRMYRDGLMQMLEVVASTEGATLCSGG